tara:strand:- start:20518 stop:20874 length:357 start_codon:yes stop_codon:yes gene_type:complete
MEEITKIMNKIEKEAQQMTARASKLERRQAIVNNLIECATHGHDLELRACTMTLEKLTFGRVLCVRCGSYLQIGNEEDWKLSTEYCDLDDDIPPSRYVGGDDDITLSEFLSGLESEEQ